MKVAIVGCGGIGMAHARAYREIPETEIACVVDRNLALAKEKAAEIGCAALGDAGEIPDDVECVSVVTPPSTHHAIVKTLLSKGHHVFSEKPNTMDIDKARELVEQSHKCGRLLGVGFKMPMSERTALRLEARGYLTVVDSDTSVFCKVEFGEGGCAFVTRGSTLFQAELSAAIAFGF